MHSEKPRFQPRMRQIAFGGRDPSEPAGGAHSAPPVPLAVLGRGHGDGKGEKGKGRGGKERRGESREGDGKGGKVMEGKGKGPHPHTKILDLPLDIISPIHNIY